MQRYNITELSNKSLDELREIATEIGISPESISDKKGLIYEILDQQALSVAGSASTRRRPGRPRKAQSESAPTTTPQEPQSPAATTPTPEASEDPASEAPKRKRGRPSKADTLAREQALTAVAKASQAQDT